jgi:uncharacterized protein YjiS (DUF1127 family)
MTTQTERPRSDAATERTELSRADMAAIYREAQRLRSEAFGEVFHALGRAIRKDIPETYRRWQAERRTARALSALDPRILQDIGLSPADIDIAAARAAGRLPEVRHAPSSTLPQGSGVIDFLVSVERVLAQSIFAHERAGKPANSDRPKAA